MSRHRGERSWGADVEIAKRPPVPQKKNSDPRPKNGATGRPSAPSSTSSYLGFLKVDQKTARKTSTLNRKGVSKEKKGGAGPGPLNRLVGGTLRSKELKSY